ncbi:hypothetical protein PshuTeo2_51640 (plasmid) [Pseudomonas hunanensis]|nr:hypothetical protein [Pseudomonas hunanensis]
MTKASIVTIGLQVLKPLHAKLLFANPGCGEGRITPGRLDYMAFNGSSRGRTLLLTNVRFCLRRHGRRLRIDINCAVFYEAGLQLQGQAIHTMWFQIGFHRFLCQRSAFVSSAPYTAALDESIWLNSLSDHLAIRVNPWDQWRLGTKRYSLSPSVRVGNIISEPTDLHHTSNHGTKRAPIRLLHLTRRTDPAYANQADSLFNCQSNADSNLPA